jgi:Dyp-type peroxidase family
VSRLDLARIQGFVVRGYRLPFAGYLFLRIVDVPRAGAWLAEIAEEALIAAEWSQKPESGVNVAVTFAGLRMLGLPDATLAGFPEEFRQGMAARAALLGDTDESAPEHWEGGLGTPDIHVLVMISAAHREALEAHDRRIRAQLEGNGGLTVVYEDLGVALPGGVEHFGYADGFAQPTLEGSPAGDTPGGGAVRSGGRWRPIRAGEFILGYEDEEGVLPSAPPPDELSCNGSFLAYRKLHQNVAAFRAMLADAAAPYPGGEELLAAKVVGRWRDGTPLDLSATAPDPAIAGDEQRNNAFSYGSDASGTRCPVGSHIRRVNPRDSLPFEGKLVNRHRLIRRGIPYGDPLPPGASDDGADRGVLFMCLQASIARQFEFVQSQWLGQGNTLGLGEDQDVLLGPQDGQAPRKMTIPGEPPFMLGPLSRMVTVRGGEYFFVPGINGLHYLAGAAGGGAA